CTCCSKRVEIDCSISSLVKGTKGLVGRAERCVGASGYSTGEAAIGRQRSDMGSSPTHLSITLLLNVQAVCQSKWPGGGLSDHFPDVRRELGEAHAWLLSPAVIGAGPFASRASPGNQTPM